MKVGALVLAAGLVLPATGTLAAEDGALTGDQLRKTVSGKTVFLKISGFELPIKYAANGRMTGNTCTGGRKPRARRRFVRQRQVVGGERPALPEMDRLDGRQDLLLQAHTAGEDDGALGA